LWVKCENCRQIIWKKDLEENLNVCPKCSKHFRIVFLPQEDVLKKAYTEIGDFVRNRY